MEDDKSIEAAHNLARTTLDYYDGTKLERAELAIKWIEQIKFNLEADRYNPFKQEGRFTYSVASLAIKLLNDYKESEPVKNEGGPMIIFDRTFH